MDLVSPRMIPPLARPVINSSHSACILFTNQFYALFVILPTRHEFLMAGNSISFKCVTSPGQSILPLWVCVESTAHKKNTRCTMETSQSIRKGMQNRINVGPEPQYLTLVNEDLDVRASFEQVRCMVFCRKIQGFNVNLVE
jgi:hypothetical protein